jgi:hypothetical protein
MDYNQTIKEIAKRNGGLAGGVLIASSILFVIKLLVTQYDGTPQSGMVTALLAFISGAALATCLRWKIVANVIRR